MPILARADALSRLKFAASMMASSLAAKMASALAGLSWMTPRLEMGTPVSPANSAASCLMYSVWGCIDPCENCPTCGRSPSSSLVMANHWPMY